jgi:IS30 family transposase
MIGTRPAVVETRRRIGDWEIDTVHGRGKACLVTIVERKTGLVRVGPIRRATKELTLERTIELLWAEKQRVKTITADNGCEFHNYKDLEQVLETEVYFATPHHAWERGSNENANGLIRQYFPKGTNLMKVTRGACRNVMDKLNDRPRKRLGFRTPNELYGLSPFVAL